MPPGGIQKRHHRCQAFMPSPLYFRKIYLFIVYYLWRERGDLEDQGLGNQAIGIRGALSLNTTGVYSGLTMRPLGSSPDTCQQHPLGREAAATGPFQKGCGQGQVPLLLPSTFHCWSPTVRPPWNPREITWLPGGDRIEVEVAIMVCWGLKGKPTGTRMSFCYCFLFFVPKPTARVLYF